MDEEEEQTIEGDVVMITETDDNAISRVLERAMPEDIDTEGKINEILGIQQ